MLLAPAPLWKVDAEGIAWTVRQDAPPHRDHIETSGEKCSLILSYGTGEGSALVQSPHVVWPMLRTLPNDTHASLQATFDPEHRPTLTVDGQPASEVVRQIRLDGFIRIDSRSGLVSVKRVWFVSRQKPVAIEKITVRNEGDQAIRVGLRPALRTRETDPAKGLEGAYTIEAVPWQGEEVALAPHASREMAVFYTAFPTKYLAPDLPFSVQREERERARFLRESDESLNLLTPDPVVDRMFHFAKIRASESLFRTKGGLIHSPGGGSYYAAIWANDQAEYANPLFGYLGYADAEEAAETSFDWFAQYMNPEFKPIPSSIIAEGTSYWNGAGDRGDMAMIAYGASRYALSRGDKRKAEHVWPLIEWCLDYLERKKSPEGILLSDSDELEGRFPAGKANLNTSCLAYDALLSSAYLARDLGHPEKASLYQDRAQSLRKAIDAYFAAKVEGFDTYRYYDGNDVLRAWIATPLTVGIFDHAPGTLAALFSSRLWTEDGLASQAGDATFWDRATLYGFRGAFAAGGLEQAMPRFLSYTQRRLTGDHVPYAVEAYPEGNQRHLSAESALYVRAVTEGLFGIRPMGLHRFELNPHVPKEWGDKPMSLRNFPLAGSTVSIRADRRTTVVRIKGQRERRFPAGEPILIDLEASR